MENTSIDFVITWVNGNDPEWMKIKKQYQPEAQADDTINRYRDFGLLRYWFRGVERFAPWVNRIHLVTCGHLPDWLRLDHPKLHIVKHANYLSPDVLPTFNSNAIELSMHKIPELSERFVYFNDDMFLLQSVSDTDFFKDGLPVDRAILSPAIADPNDNGISKTVLNNMYIINRHFDKKLVLKNNRAGFLEPRYGTQMLRTVCLLPWHHLPGFYNDHLPVPYRKQTFNEVWESEGETLREVTAHRFRDCSRDVNHWLMRYWQFCSGTFSPAIAKRGADLDITADDTTDIIKSQRYKMICINDKISSESQFISIQRQVESVFLQILPEKSAYEK